MKMFSEKFSSAVRTTTRSAARSVFAVTLAAAGLAGTAGIASAATTTTPSTTATTSSTTTVSLAGTTTATSGRVLYAAPAGTGKTCTVTVPCTVATAVAISVGGDTVQLAGGSYGDVTVKGGKATTTAPVTVTPAAGATATFGRLVTTAPNLIWTGKIVDTVTFYINGGATGTVVDGILLDGGGMFLRSNNVVVKNSEFRGGSSIDGIQIARATGVLLQNNYIHDYNQTKGGSTGYHADCVQIFDANNVTVRGNTMRNCYNTGVIFSSGSNWGINNVLVESNFIQGCLVKSAACANGVTIDARYEKMTGVVIRNNTMLNGAARLISSGATFDRNIIDYLSDCGAKITNSIVSSWNLGLCKVPAAIQGNGNRVGTVQVVNDATGDLRLVNANDATLVPTGTAAAAPTDRFGTVLPANVAGADTPSVSALAVAAAANLKAAQNSANSAPASANDAVGSSVTADTTKPTATVTSPTNNSTVTGTVTATFTATDNVAVTKVQVMANGVTVGTAAKKGTGWALTVNTKTLPKGVWNVTARAYDAAGNYGDSKAVKITVA